MIANDEEEFSFSAETVDYIIISEVFGQWTFKIHRDEASFLSLKHLAWQHFDVVSFESNTKTWMPLLSTNPDKTLLDKQIDESKRLEDYNLENGGVLYFHMFDFMEQLEMDTSLL